METYEYEKVEQVVPEEQQIYKKKIKAVDVDGVEYVKRTKNVTRESLVKQKESLEAEIKAIDALEAEQIKEA